MGALPPRSVPSSCRARLWLGGRSLPSPRGARQVSPSRCTAAGRRREALAAATKIRRFQPVPLRRSEALAASRERKTVAPPRLFSRSPSAPSRLEAAFQLRLRPRSSGWRPSTARRQGAGAGAGAGTSLGRCGEPAALSFGFRCARSCHRGFPPLGDTKSG